MKAMTLMRHSTRPAVLRALGSRPFALLWSGQTLSRIGDALYQIALAWWVLEQTGSAAMMASLLIVSLLPTLVFLLIGGVVVDRYPRLTIMLASDLLRALVTGVVTLMAIGNLLAIWHLYLLHLVFGIVDAFFQPATQAVIPELVAADDLPSANALTSLGDQTGRIIGPALGALVIAVGGPTLAFAFNCLTFIIAAVCLLPLSKVSVRTPAQPQAEVTGMLADISEGIATVRNTPWLWVSILVMAFSNLLLGGAYSVSLPFLVRDHLHADIGTLSVLYALFPVGYVLGTLVLGRQAQIRRHGSLIYAGLALAGLALGLFGLALPLAVLGIAACVNGCAIQIANIAWTNALQQRVPVERLGRVLSIDMLGSFALVPVGYALAGGATEILGAPLVFIVAGGLTMALAGSALIFQRAIWRCS